MYLPRRRSLNPTPAIAGRLRPNLVPLGNDRVFYSDGNNYRHAQQGDNIVLRTPLHTSTNPYQATRSTALLAVRNDEGDPVRIVRSEGSRVVLPHGGKLDVRQVRRYPGANNGDARIISTEYMNAHESRGIGSPVARPSGMAAIPSVSPGATGGVQVDTDDYILQKLVTTQQEFDIMSRQALDTSDGNLEREVSSAPSILSINNNRDSTEGFDGLPRPRKRHQHGYRPGIAR